MHERSLVQALLRQVESIRQDHAAQRVLTVRVSVGEFSGVEPELLQFAFADLTSMSVLDGAELTVDRVPLECSCRDCGAATRVEQFRFECANCQGRNLDIVRGEELTLESVTLAGEKL